MKKCRIICEILHFFNFFYTIIQRGYLVNEF